MKQLDMLGRIMMLVIQSGVCPETPRHKWPKIILDAHKLGYLYTNQDLTTAVLAYRVPEWNSRWQDEMPTSESGDILVIGWCASSNPNKLGLLRMLRDYLNEHPNVGEVIYNRHSQNDALRRFQIGKVKVA